MTLELKLASWADLSTALLHSVRFIELILTKKAGVGGWLVLGVYHFMRSIMAQSPNDTDRPHPYIQYPYISIINSAQFTKECYCKKLSIETVN